MQHRKKMYFFENGVKKLILNINSASKFKTKFGIIYNVIINVFIIFLFEA